MKTPKRKHCDIYKCEKCGGYGITFTADDTTSALYQCTLCGTCWHMPGLPKRTRAFRARCIRKNRETRLRHKIYWQARDIEWLSETNKRMRKKCAGLASLLVLADIQHDCDVGNFNASGTYGHDIEGS